MENTSDFEGGSVDCGQSTTDTELKEELVANLTSFLQLYSQHQDLQKTSEHFTLTAVNLEMQEKDSDYKNTFMSGLFGGAFGAVCGGVTGGVGGAVGASGAVTYSVFCGDLTAVSATVGFVGSVVGGAVGGSIGGMVGGAVSAAASGTGSRGYSVVCDLFIHTLGCAFGGAIGGCFDWRVGAAGGAAGAVLGVLVASREAASLATVIRDLEEQKIRKNKAHMTEITLGFSENAKLLVEQLKTIKTICDKMAASSAGVQSVAEQTVKTVAALTMTEKAVSALGAEEVMRQSRQTTEELKKTSTEAKKLLDSLRKG